jgi:hypothetical protein
MCQPPKNEEKSFAAMAYVAAAGADLHRGAIEGKKGR